MRKKKKKTILIVVAVLLLLLSTVAGYAAYSSISELNGKANTKAVKIGITNYTEQEGKLTPLEGITTIAADEDVSFIPQVTNKGEPCYIRVKINGYEGSKETCLSSVIYGINDGWVKQGDYLYLTKPLENKEKISVCEGFHFPSDWDYRATNKLTVNVVADAIQDVNFSPNFRSEDPWGNVEVQDSQVSENAIINTLEKNSGIKVVLGNTKKGVTIEADDFFENLTFMPGDIKEDSITIKNSNDRDVTVYFKAAYKDSKLADEMNLSIRDGKFYKGSLASKDLTEYTPLVEVKGNSSRTVDFSIELPREADNQYQLSEADIVWYLAIDDPNATGNTPVNDVKTGDNNPWLVIASLITLAGSAICICLLIRGRKYEDEDI